jgi:RNA polymerase sigma-70 factor (ECF subfamily)
VKPVSGGVTVPHADGDSAGGIDAIVRRAQNGDVDAFELVYRAHVRAVHALCLRMCGNSTEARELLQDVFVRAWERLPGFRGQSALTTWLHRMAVNVVLERWRSNKREALRMIDNSEELVFDAQAPREDVEAGIDIDAAMMRLPAGARAVFVLHDIEGYSHEEIAAMTGIAAGTSRTQLFRARRALARLLS